MDAASPGLTSGRSGAGGGLAAGDADSCPVSGAVCWDWGHRQWCARLPGRGAEDSGVLLLPLFGCLLRPPKLPRCCFSSECGSGSIPAPPRGTCLSHAQAERVLAVTP